MAAAKRKRVSARKPAPPTSAPTRDGNTGEGRESGFPIVGLGASAGGLDALQGFFRAVPADSGMGFVVVLHLDPQRQSLLASILTRWTEMPVVTARDGELIEPNHVYVIPRACVMTIARGKLRIRGRADPSERMSIDAFFTSLAADQAENAICIVLSGSGSDGSIGLRAVKEHGGLTLAQGSNGSHARFPEMPENAQATGLVDIVAPVEDMPGRIIDYVRHKPQTEALSAASERRAQAMRLVYSLLRARVGHDFSRYKERTFIRRLQRRMQILQLSTIEEYAERLKQDANEAWLLFADLLIGVTNFFRDPEAFAALEKHLPRLFAGKGPEDAVRVWVVGCATGEEAYSLAILLREHAETLQLPARIQVFATDIDEHALATARLGRYPEALLKALTPVRLKRFFAHEDGQYHVIKEIRDLCVFSAHSVIRDPPFSRLDLITCRNLLIYLNADLQAQVIPFFHYALRPGGLLFLGSSENVSRHGELFAPLDKRFRIFERQNLVTRPEMPLSLIARPSGLRAELGPLLSHGGGGPEPPSLPAVLRQIANLVQEQYGPAYVVVNKDGDVVYYSGRTGRYLEPAEGPPSRDLTTMTRKGLRLDLRTALNQARETGETVRRENVLLQLDQGIQPVTVTVQPVVQGNERVFVVVFADAAPVAVPETPEKTGSPSSEAEATIQQLERELLTTRERLQTTIEEFDTSTEELKSSNEELLSVNEELQSVNEELETSKEEIQSVNEELQTVNAELTSKLEELDRANADLKNLFESTQIATIILDKNLLIRHFTPGVERIFNLIPSDRGRPLSDFVSRLDDAGLQRDIRVALERGQELERRVTAEAGRVHYLMRILPYRSPAKDINSALITFVEITSIIEAEEHEKVLVSELGSRVKATLDIVRSVVADSLKGARTLEEYSSAVRDRVEAVMRVQALVAKRHWAEAPLRELVAAEIKGRAGRRRRDVTIMGPDIVLYPRAALALGMAIHELAAEAVERGALSVPQGRVALEWSLREASRTPVLSLTWTESGASPPAKKGRGVSRGAVDLIQHSLGMETGGQVKIEQRRGGVRCTIQIPAAQNLFERTETQTGKRV